MQFIWDILTVYIRLKLLVALLLVLTTFSSSLSLIYIYRNFDKFYIALFLAKKTKTSWCVYNFVLHNWVYLWWGKLPFSPDTHEPNYLLTIWYTFYAWKNFLTILSSDSRYFNLGFPLLSINFQCQVLEYGFMLQHDPKSFTSLSWSQENGPYGVFQEAISIPEWFAVTYQLL